MSVEVANESGTPVDESALVALARHVLYSLEVNPLADLSLRLVDVATMERLHVRWMDEPGPTDVLAFPMDELTPGHPGGEEDDGPPALLGDVVLCPAVADRQAEAAGHSRQDELDVLCTHGILHLLGYDHADAAGEQAMFGAQARLLRAWHDSGPPPGGADPP